MKRMVETIAADLIEALAKLIAVDGEEIQIGKDLFVDGNIILNSALHLVDTDGNPLITGGSSDIAINTTIPSGVTPVDMENIQKGNSFYKIAQADWNQVDENKVDFIKNKPSIAEQVQSDWNQADNTKVDFIKNKPTKATSISGSGVDTDYVTSKVVVEYISSLTGDNTDY